MKRNFACVFFLLLFWNALFRIGFTKILSPEEAFPLLQRVAEKMTHRSYWGVWERKDYFRKKHTFYEILFLENVGWGWKELDGEKFWNVKVRKYRYIFNIASRELEGIHPVYSLPFLPFEKEDIELILKNYLVYFQDGWISLFSSYSGEVVYSFRLDEDGFLASQVSYSPRGRVEEEGRFVYVDFSPDYSRLTPYLELMEECFLPAEEELSVVEKKKIFFPRLLPPGFELKNTYMVKSGGRKFYHLVYSDGLRYFAISQSVYPREVPRSFDFQPRFSRQTEDESLVLIGEKEGFSISFTGNFDMEIGFRILQSLEKEGGH
ncbi:MAG: hypothetical protein ACUVQZ_01305 [Candidatus Caldatribacteriaceae bacterium]